MEINVVAAVIAGLVGTAVMTSMMLYGRKLNLPAVDAHGILGYMQSADSASGLGYLMHFALGAVFAIQTYSTMAMMALPLIAQYPQAGLQRKGF